MCGDECGNPHAPSTVDAHRLELVVCHAQQCRAVDAVQHISRRAHVLVQPGGHVVFIPVRHARWRMSSLIGGVWMDLGGRVCGGDGVMTMRAG